MYQKLECPSKAIRDAAVAAKTDALVVWGGYTVTADGYRWFIHWIA